MQSSPPTFLNFTLSFFLSQLHSSAPGPYRCIQQHGTQPPPLGGARSALPSPAPLDPDPTDPGTGGRVRASMVALAGKRPCLTRLLSTSLYLWRVGVTVLARVLARAATRFSPSFPCGCGWTRILCVPSDSRLRRCCARSKLARD